MQVKFLKFVLVISLLTGLFTACTKEPNHSMRIQNDFLETLQEFHIGNVDYGDIESGTTTEYKPIDHGISGYIATAEESGVVLEGEITIEGTGDYKWTMVIATPGDITVVND